MKDLGDALEFGAQVFSAVRSGWLSLTVQWCFRGAAELFVAETVEYPAKEFLWGKYLLPFLFSLNENILKCSLKCVF